MLKSKVAVLGAGRVGSTFYDLYQDVFDIEMFDHNAESLPCHVTQFELDDEEMLSSIIRNAGYIINTVPVYDPSKVARVASLCVVEGSHYLDLSEDLAVSWAIAQACESLSAPDVVIAPHCGLAPGAINIFGTFMLRTFTNPISLNMGVGALTWEASNDLLYVPTWNIEGIVNEYLSPFEGILDGNVQLFGVQKGFSVPQQQEFLQKMILYGREYEAFPTSGGCSTLFDTIRTEFSSVRTAMYRSIRYPGHHAEVMKVLQVAHKLVDDQRGKEVEFTKVLTSTQAARAGIDMLRAAMELEQDPSARDYVIGVIKVTGKNVVSNNKTMNVTSEYSKSCTFTFNPITIPGHTKPTPAIQWLTAAGPYAVIRGIQDGHIKPGFHKQEDLDMENYLEYMKEVPVIGEQFESNVIWP